MLNTEEEKKIVELVDKIIQLKEPLNPLRGDFEEDNIEYLLLFSVSYL